MKFRICLPALLGFAAAVAIAEGYTSHERFSGGIPYSDGQYRYSSYSGNRWTYYDPNYRVGIPYYDEYGNIYYYHTDAYYPTWNSNYYYFEPNKYKQGYYTPLGNDGTIEVSKTYPEKKEKEEDDRYLTRDAIITKQIQALLDANKKFSQNAKSIQITTFNGGVTLSGFVDTYGELSELETAARSVRGVSYVNNHLRINKR